MAVERGYPEHERRPEQMVNGPLTAESLIASMRAIAAKPYEPDHPVYFSRASWAWWLNYFGEEPTGFRYVRPDGALVNPCDEEV